MQKNLVLAVVLSSIVYIGWYSMVAPPPPRQIPVEGEQKAGVTTAASVADAQPLKFSEDASALSYEPVKIKVAKAEYVLDPRTASLTGAVYDGPVEPVDLVPEGSAFFSAFEGLRFAPAGSRRYSASFEARPEQGILISKTFDFDPDNRINTLTIKVSNQGAAARQLQPWALKIGPGISTVKSEQKENPSLWRALYAVQQKDKKNPTPVELEKDSGETEWLWAGVDNRYFLAAVLGEGLEKTGLKFLEEKSGEETDAPSLLIPFASELLPAGESKTWKMDFYLGPKHPPLLRELGRGLDRAVDFGFFSPLAKLADKALGYFHAMTGNYGVAILILSVVLQIFVMPLSFKSYKAMTLMKKLQPEMQRIQAKYKDTPQRMNQEIMEMYKKHGANPLGGCLPMLLQIPIFFALFTALSNSWSLHGAPFALWITDLSSRDPYYVLPLTMGAVMVLQQHFSPQAGDPMQARIMKWLPVIFTFMFLTFPAGLVMYWLVNSLFGFAQSMYMQKKYA
ncbi:MAG: preprotein translocase subunit YidC [Elusimicrobia bacterium]|nr:MAG: preprotein translocase subunit YidC [Elusimicrobiota bacterium]KAF0153827.1 MAG: preprotein translocase subunit YidC [Elusimicrobiota bacterium]